MQRHNFYSKYIKTQFKNLLVFSQYSDFTCIKRSDYKSTSVLGKVQIRLFVSSLMV